LQKIGDLTHYPIIPFFQYFPELSEGKVFQSFLSKIAKLRIFGKHPVGVYLRLNKWIWNHLPPSLTTLGLMRSYGIFLHTLTRLSAIRSQNVDTFFLRNRPELELIRRISCQKSKGATFKISVLACSNGAEVYSILWKIGSALPDLKVIMHAVDISKEVLKFAQKGVYTLLFGASLCAMLLTTPDLVDVPIFERMSEEEMGEIFDREDDKLKVKSWIRDGIIWHLGDARDPEILNVFGLQDMVVANNFLCHMNPPDAERCLRIVARLVKPGGYLFVSGVDLDVRTKVARDLGWEPLQDLIEEIHDGDPSLRNGWPWAYWGLEPFNKRRHDWKLRYASAFQLDEKI
jgi:SAM-dependent methyltransferase